jgi:hypothetical protein
LQWVKASQIPASCCQFTALSCIAGVPVYLLRTPDGNEGMSTLPADGVDAGAQGVDVVSRAVEKGESASCCKQLHGCCLGSFP